MKDLLKQYFDLLEKIYDEFGYEESWIPYIMDLMEDYYWKIGYSPKLQSNPEFVRYSYSTWDESTDEDTYTESIYKDRFHKNHVWRNADFTMILCDTGCDGVKLLRIFDNALEER